MCNLIITFMLQTFILLLTHMKKVTFGADFTGAIKLIDDLKWLSYGLLLAIWACGPCSICVDLDIVQGSARLYNNWSFVFKLSVLLIQFHHRR